MISIIKILFTSDLFVGEGAEILEGKHSSALMNDEIDQTLTPIAFLSTEKDREIMVRAKMEKILKGLRGTRIPIL